MKKSFIYIIGTLLAAVSCGSPEQDNGPQTFADTISPSDSSQYSAVLNGYSRSRKGSIALIGEADRTRALALNIMKYDGFDNATGVNESDALADFSGENFDVIYDVDHSPYSYSPDSAEVFNAIQLRNIILSLDTISYDSRENLSEYILKDAAKAVVLSSMYTDVASEVEKINKNFGLDVKVFEQGSILKDYLSKHFSENTYIAVWGRKDAVEPEFYHDIATSIGMRTYSTVMDLETTRSTAWMNLDTLLVRYLDTLAVRRPHSKLSCIIVDDWSLASRVPILNAKVAKIIASDSQKDIARASLLSKDFRFVNPMDLVSAELYRYLRKENLFTHRVDTPLFTSFVTLQVGEEYALANYGYGK